MVGVINGSSRDQEREDGGVYKKVNRNNVGVIMPVHILWGSWHKSNLFLYIIKNKKKEQEKDGAEG